MMKQYTFSPKIITTSILLLIACSCFAQKMRDEKVNIQYIRLPFHKIPEFVKTYSQSIELESTWGKDLDGQYWKDNYLQLNGYETVEKDADLVIHIKVSGLTISGLDSRKLRGKYTRNKTEYKYFYYDYKMKCHFPAVELILETENGVFIERKLGKSDFSNSFGNYSYETAYKTKEELQAAWVNSKESFLTDAESNAYKNAMNEIAIFLSEYALREREYSEDISRVFERKKGTKHNYQDYDKAVSLCVEGMRMIQTDKIALTNKLVQPKYEESRANITEAIAIWQKMLEEESDLENKKARINAKITRHTYLNIAKAYLWIEDFAKAKEYWQYRKDNVGALEKNLLAGLTKFRQFLDEQERRYILNSWRDIYITEADVINSVSKERSRQETVDKELSDAGEISKDNPAMLYIYCPKGMAGMMRLKKYGLFFNNQQIFTIESGDRLAFKMYSEGYLKVNSEKVNTNGEVADREFEVKKDEVDLKIEKGQEYFLKINGINGVIVGVSQIEGEELFKNEKKWGRGVRDKEENIDNPIPNMSIAQVINQN